MNDPSATRSLHVWSAADGQVHRVTDDVFNEYAPSWDPEGKYLYYLSERQFAPQISQVEWNYAGARMTGLFALTLKKDGKDPFPPPSDEVTPGDKKDEAKDEKARAGDDAKADKDEAKAEPEKKETPFRVDFEGLGARVTRVPVEADNYHGVVAVKGALLYVKSDAPFYGREPAREDDARLLPFKDRKESTLAEGVDCLGRLARRQEGPRPRRRRPAPPRREARREGARRPSPTTGLMVDRVPAEEWKEIFDEVWRRYRDFFYVREHARLRLEGARQAVRGPLAATWRTAPT